ncbi:MAG TPA: prolyl oligopeptidase family serine peptidase [Thermoanaerobaculia bacterium]|nr:prolyl oligopeptidase family serine peptidase [Thermoanaerobaculia bacterium]
MLKTIKITVLAVLLAACATAPKPTIPPPPATETHPVTETLHGVEITDSYQWLEDQNAPATRAWIDQQNAYTDKILGDLPQKALFAKRLESLLAIETIEVPEVHAGRYFFRKRGAGQDLYAIYMREGANGTDQLLIDPAPLNPKHTTNVGIYDISDDGKRIAYWQREGGADEVEVHFFDVDARNETGEPIRPASRFFSVSLTSDGSTAYYTRVIAEGPRVFRRAVSGGEETKLFGDGYGREKLIYTSLSDDGSQLLAHLLHGSAAPNVDIFLKDLRNDSPFVEVSKDRGARSTASFADNALVIETNWKASNERVMIASFDDPSNWKEIVAENPNAAIQDVALAGGRVFVRYLENVKPRVVAYDLGGNRTDEIQLETIGRLEAIEGEWSSPTAFFRFSSFHVPSTIYEYNVTNKQRSVFARVAAPVNSDDFTIEQVWFHSKDGTRVPMFVMYKKGLQRDGSHPAYLTAYGGFTQSQLPGFSPRAIAWAEQGGVYALAGLRGGGEFGETWHRAGMLEKKQNVFDDFAAAAEFLSREQYTSARHLGIQGTSNGGLLVTALETQHPELVHAVICGYPLIDMIRYHKFLVAGFWVPEYGNAERAEDFKWIYPYSPYQHVTKGAKYPATLFITGDADTRVAPLHARKMTALMQSAQGGDAPIMLRYHVSGGHSGGEPLNVQVNNEAESLAFLWWQLK